MHRFEFRAFPIFFGVAAILPLLTSPLQVYFQSGIFSFDHLAHLIVTMLVLTLGTLAFSLPKLGNYRVLFAFSILLYLLSLTQFYIGGIQFSEKMGTPAIYIVTITPFLFLLFLCQRWGWVPTLTYPILVLALFLFKPLNTEIENSSEDEFVREAPGECLTPYATCYFESWLYSRPDLDFYREQNAPYPVYFVSASGGGIYAAAHTDAFLRKLTQVCPHFAAHLFAVSSVSGGSFGAAIYASDPSLPWEVPVSSACGAGDPHANELFDRDFLSPIAAAFAFGNIPQFFFPFDIGADNSGKMLARVFTHHTSQPDFLLPQSRTWSYKKNRPAVFFNVVDSLSGKQEVIAPFSLNIERTENYGHSNIPFSNVSLNIPMAEAASLSSRFPVLTPPSRFISADDPDSKAMILLDGGYVDNSGSSVMRVLYQDIESLAEYLNCVTFDSSRRYCGYRTDLWDCLEGAEKSEYQNLCAEYFWRKKLIPITLNVIQLRADESADAYLKGEDSEKSRARPAPTASEPIKAILNARSARSSSSRSLFQYTLFGEMACHDCEFSPSEQIYREHILDVSSLKLPLSWTLTNEQYDRVWDQVGHPKSCDDSDVAGIIEYNSCILALITKQINYEW